MGYARQGWLEGAALRALRGCLGHLVRLGCVALVAYAVCYGLDDGFGSLAKRAERLFYPVGYQSHILASCARHGVDPLLVCAVIRCESGWDAEASSSAGAQGLMQLMPSTAEELIRQGYVDAASYSADDLFDPETNIEFGCAYLQYAAERLSSRDEVIASYNAGIGKVREWLSQGGSDITELAQEYPETSNYIEKVNAALAHYQRLYTPGLEEAA